MNGENPLADLRDIHLPDAVSAWPPAPGWWILTFILLSLSIWIICKLIKKYQQKNLLRVSLASINSLEQDYSKHQDPQLLIRQYSSLLRRIAIARFSRQQVASLTGSHWLDFLNSSADTQLFSTEAGNLLLSAPYQKPDIEIQQIDVLTQSIKTWIKAVTLPRVSSANSTSLEMNL